MFRSLCDRWLPAAAILLIIFCLQLQPISMQETVDHEHYECARDDTEVKYVKYFTVHPDRVSDVVFNFEHPSPCPDNNTNTEYELLKVKVLYPNVSDQVVAYWNKTAILLRIPYSSPLANYMEEHRVCMSVRYIHDCNISATDISEFGKDENVHEEHIFSHLRPFSIQLKVPSGELTAGHPLNLTCSVVGYIRNKTEQKDDITIEYISSVSNIETNCNNDSDRFEADHSFNHTCVVKNHTNQSDSGHYSCDVIIKHSGHTYTLTSDKVNLKVEQDWTNTIIEASVGGGIGLLIILVLVIVNVAAIVMIYGRKNYVRRQPRPLPLPPPIQPPLPVQEVNNHEAVPLIGHYDGIAQNQVRDQFNQERHGHGVAHHQRLNGNLDRRQRGRQTPLRAGSALSNRREERIYENLHDRGYESAM